MITAVLDANALYPAPIRDLLLSIAEEELFKPVWSATIQDEWIRNLLIKRTDLNRKQLDRTADFMNLAFPDAMIEDYEKWIPEITLKDPDDRHVIAVAIQTKSQYIVTFNLKDFANASSFGRFQVLHPDQFILELISLNPAAVYHGFTNMMTRLKNPPQSKAELLQTLTTCGLDETAKHLEMID